MKERATIVCRKGDQILLVTRGRSRWTLPGGTIRRDEAPLHAARREMHEETLIVAESLTYLFAFGGLSKRHYVFAFDLPDDAIPQPANEIVRCCWVQPASIATLTTSVPTREIVTHLCVPAAKHPQVSPDR